MPPIGRPTVCPVHLRRRPKGDVEIEVETYGRVRKLDSESLNYELEAFQIILKEINNQKTGSRCSI